MPRTVIFIEDGSVTAKRLKRVVAASGWTIHEVTNDDALWGLLASEELPVLVHVPSEPRRFASVMARVAREFPGVPVLHVIDAATFQPQEWLKSHLHEWLGINAPVEAVLRKLDTLLHFARVERDLISARAAESRVAEFTRAIRGLESRPVVKRAMEILASELKAQNVIWFPEDSLHRETERQSQFGNVLPIAAVSATRASWMGLIDFGLEDVEAMLKAWRQKPSRDVLDSAPVEVESGEAKDLVVPIGPFAGDRSTQKPYGHLIFRSPQSWRSSDRVALWATLFDLLGQQLCEVRAYERLQTMMFKDDLTDLYNQRYLPQVLQQELDRASRMEKAFSVLFLDVDYFKNVNDTKGHLVGSRVLVELSELLKGSIRRTDYAFRYGGDEYVIVLSGADSRNAALVAERLRTRTAQKTFDINGNEVRVTVSIGIATYPEHAKSTEELLNMADEAMYDGKHKSRNIVSVAS